MCFELFERRELKRKSQCTIVDKQLGYVENLVKKDNIPIIKGFLELSVSGQRCQGNSRIFHLYPSVSTILSSIYDIQDEKSTRSSRILLSVDLLLSLPPGPHSCFASGIPESFHPHFPSVSTVPPHIYQLFRNLRPSVTPPSSASLPASSSALCFCFRVSTRTRRDASVFRCCKAQI